MAERAAVTTPGIVYISRIPPGMKHQKVRHLMSQFGGVGRVFLQPEDAAVRKRRQRFGGSKRKNFTEGWVEFDDKRIAKSVARSLNATQIGGQKHSRYYDDLWNIKYLPKFRWTHLTEKLAYEAAVRQQKMRTEMSQAKRETRFYMENVDKQKEFSAIEERKRKRGQETEETHEWRMRSFRQRKTLKTDEESREANPVDVPSLVLSKVLPSDT
ncbi:uncharacterized protein LOC134192997 isoform X2 [Corticium candelabrum]|uniref:uncharacterized protein LOC134192997 isoform X2 n=1 Tax=Corticium candelabrum TaxID=121492 RepID=UPI002E25DC0F|nr:uncharacterized protein LOC134192997 isoform X2 [Corticium candelabrum]